MRKLATVRSLAEIRPIPGADRIVVAQVDGWECVVQKNEFEAGDKIVYVEVDSVMPERPEFEFLRDRKFRVRTIRLRGQISQGLVLPMTVLPDGRYELGDDVTDILGITKYDPEAQQEAKLVKPQKPQSKFRKFMMRFAWYRKLFAKSKRKGGFPEWIVKTDETRIQNLPQLFEAERDRGRIFMVTEKLDGQSATYFLKRLSKRRFEFGVCSRNLRLATPDDSSYWTVAKQYNIEIVLKNLIGNKNSVVLQGEICGDKIQKNKYQINGYRFFAFNLIFDAKEPTEYKCDTQEIRSYLFGSDIDTVPIITSEKVLPDTIAELVEYAKGWSVVRPEQKREGIVMRSRRGDISFKAINPEFLLEDDT